MPDRIFMTNQTNENRCRIVLIAPEDASPDGFADGLRQALDGGDVASLILPQYGMDEATFQRLAETATPIAKEQARGLAVTGVWRHDGARVGNQPGRQRHGDEPR